MSLSHYLIQLAPYSFLELPARRICSALIVGKVFSTFPSSQILQLLRSLTLQKGIGGKLNYLKKLLFESFYPGLYSNKMKNWEFDKEVSQLFQYARAAVFIDTERGVDEKIEEKPMQSKTNSSFCLSICPTFWPTVSRMPRKVEQKPEKKSFKNQNFLSKGRQKTPSHNL